MKTRKAKTLCLMLVVIMALSCFAPSSAVLQMGQAVTVEAATTPKLNKTKASLGIGESLQLKVTGTKKKVTWKSSNTKVATVNSNGKVKAVKKGTAYISAVVSGKTLKCKVTVKNVQISETHLEMFVGGTAQLSISGTSKKVKWASDNNKVAKVNQNGLVTAIGEGDAIITATVNGIKYKCEVESLDDDDNDDPVTITQSTINNNYNMLKSYINKYGSINSSGNKFIKNVMREDESVITFAIVYDRTGNYFEFGTHTESSSGESVLSMRIEMPYQSNAQVNSILVLESTGNGFETSAKLKLNSYNGNSNVKFAIDSNNTSLKNSHIQQASNSLLQMSFTGWSLLLLEKLGFTMTDMGFTNYVAG